ncbi:hypothetical protein [Iodidimonas sp. SYSU 1G8]|uniref:hypothetical protein n=1 Tax=Iodidimonas sp. SYSU 1G8 TaxID=3133967 RepID=UPI0031FF2FD1
MSASAKIHLGEIHAEARSERRHFCVLVGSASLRRRIRRLADTDAYACTDAYAYAYACTDAYARTDANPHSDTNTDAHSDAYAHADK